MQAAVGKDTIQIADDISTSSPGPPRELDPSKGVWDIRQNPNFRLLKNQVKVFKLEEWLFCHSQ